MLGASARLRQRVRLTLVRRGRIPGLRTAKATLAVVAAYLLAEVLHLSEHPIVAPLMALLVVQLTLYNFQSQFSTSWNLLFMNVLLITVPPLVVFLFFNRQIVAGMSSGAVKG